MKRRIYVDPILGIYNPRGWTVGGLLTIWGVGFALTAGIWLWIWL